MRVAIFSHKVCWSSSTSPTGYVTDGGFPFQIQALSELFDETRLLVPCVLEDSDGKNKFDPITGYHLSVIPLSLPKGRGIVRKLYMPLWACWNSIKILGEVIRADAIHTPIPGDVGSIGMMMAYLFRKPLFVRHCGNWENRRTIAESFWRWFMERVAGGKNVMVATGGGNSSPSPKNHNIDWIFSTSLSQSDLAKYSCSRISPSSPPKLITVGRQTFEKGTGVVIDALAHLIGEYPGIRLQVIGDGTDLQKFIHQAERLGLQDNVVFHGNLSHRAVMMELQRSDLFCFPTISSEGFPKVVIEAMACGLPVITTKVSVLPYLIGQGSGILLNAADPTELAEAIRHVLRDENYQKMSHKALEVVQQYSIENWRDQIGQRLSQSWGKLRTNG